MALLRAILLLHYKGAVREGEEEKRGAAGGKGKRSGYGGLAGAQAYPYSILSYREKARGLHGHGVRKYNHAENR